MKNVRKTIGRIFLALLITAMLPFSASARCGGGSASVFPGKGIIQPDQAFLIEFSGAGLIEDIQMGNLEVSLVTDVGTVPLALSGWNYGGFHQLQGFFRTTEPLVAGQSYSLEVAGLSPGALATLGKETSREVFRGNSWRVTREAQNQALSAGFVPKMINTYGQMLGCGPVLGAIYQLPESAAAVSFVEVQILEKHLPTDFIPTYIVPVESGMFVIDQGMCSGGFRLKPGTSYEIRLTAISANGQRQLIPGETPGFELPEV